jgi:hypothetical protein
MKWSRTPKALLAAAALVFFLVGARACQLWIW